MIDAAVHQSLLVRPARRSGEHAGGYWLRAAHRNGLTRPGWLLGDSSRPPVSLVRVCPACLAQSQPVWLEAWASEGRPGCASHGTWLVDACAGCKRTLRWSEVRFLACCCGQDLRALPATGMTPAVRRALIDDGVPLMVLAWLGALALHGLQGKPLKKASRQRLHRHAYDVVERLLRREGHTARLRVEAEPAADVIGAEPLAHEPRPEPPGRAELGDLLEQIVVRGKEERQAWSKDIHGESGGYGFLHIRQRIGKGEGHLLYGGGPGLADVVAADGNRIPLRDLLGTEAEHFRRERFGIRITSI